MKSTSKVSQPLLLALFPDMPGTKLAKTAPAVHLGIYMLLACLGIFALITTTTCVNPARAAEDLSLRPGLSFTQDIDNGFPILGKSMDDMTVEAGKPAFIFFGSAGDLNTNRQAKRIVDLFHHIETKNLKFVIVDVDNPANDQGKSLIKKYYKGYVPSQALIDREGKLYWDQTGETDVSTLKSQIEKCCKSL